MFLTSSCSSLLPHMCIHQTAFLYAQWSVTVIAKELPSVLKLEGKAK